MYAATDALYCYYCLRLIDEDDDAQRISKREYVHTLCAFAADEACFAALDTEAERESDDAA